MKNVLFVLVFLVFAISEIFAGTLVYETDEPAGGCLAIGPNQKCYYAAVSSVASTKVIMITNAYDEWTTSVVYEGHGFITRNSIAFNSEGNPVVLISPWSHTDPFLIARYNGSTWDIEDTGIHGFYGAIVMDQDNRIDIFYNSLDPTFYSNPYYLSWMYKSGSTWQTQPLDTTAPCGSISSVRRDDGSIHLAYTVYSSSIYRIRYATKIGDAWSIQTRKTSPMYDIYAPVILSFDNHDHPWIAHGKIGYPDNISCIHWNGSSWQDEILISQTSIYLSDMRTDIRGYPFIAYCSGHTIKTSYYIYNNGYGWSSPILLQEKTNESDSIKLPIIAFDSNNTLWNSYEYDTYEGGKMLHFARIDNYQSLGARYWQIWE